jgi:RNA polymerase sigma-70 factor (ECF subfamily)
MSSAVRHFDTILSRAAAGDASATRQLFNGCRHRLRRMIAVRMDPRLATRLDPSDVVQEALMEASSRLPRYVQEPTVSFYPWVRALAIERLIDAHRRHLAGKRSPDVEAALPAGSIWKLAQQLAVSSSGPQERSVAKEERERLYQALQRLSPKDREVLVLRYLEQLSTEETAAVLGLRESAVKMRHLRALERIRNLMQDS